MSQNAPDCPFGGVLAPPAAGSSPTAATILASERDPDKPRSFHVQTLANKDTCRAGKGGAEDKSVTPCEQIQDGALHPNCVLCVHKDSGESLPPDLRLVTDAWPDMPEAVKAGIVAMVSSATGCTHARTRGGDR